MKFNLEFDGCVCKTIQAGAGSPCDGLGEGITLQWPAGIRLEAGDGGAVGLQERDFQGATRLGTEVQLELIAGEGKGAGEEGTAGGTGADGAEAVDPVGEPAQSAVWACIVGLGGVDGVLIGVVRQAKDPPCHVIAPVPAAVLGGGLRDHGLGPAVKGQPVTAAHEDRLDAFALVGEEAGGEADKEAGIAVVQLDGVGIELLFGCAGVLQELGACPLDKGLDVANAATEGAVELDIASALGIPEGEVLRIEGAFGDDRFLTHQ